MNAALRQKVYDIFESSAIDKSLYNASGLADQSIPVFVAEWLIDRQLKGGNWDEAVQQQVITFVRKFIPSKDDVEDLKQRLRNGDQVSVLENISPRVDLKKDSTYLESGSLGNEKVQIEEHLLTKYPRLLKGGMWGLAIYSYRRNDKGGEVWLTDFKPLQAATIDVDDYISKRRSFDLEEWTQLLINSLGYNAEGEGGYTEVKTRQALLTRLIPFVHRRVNLFELAPKGTGKSFLFGQFSRYSRLIEGGAVSPAVLFYNENTKVPGLFTQFDIVVFDEAQTLSFSSPDETVAKLKGYLEQGKYSKGKFTVSADSGAVFIANVSVDNGQPVNRNNLFSELPTLLQETALLDRIHGILPGWNLPRMSVDALSKGVGLKADYLGEMFHSLRYRIEYDKYVEERQYLIGSKDFRDVRAILKLSAGYLKLLFPDLASVSEQDFVEYCLKPAVDLRQRLRDQLHYMDAEYKNYEITIEQHQSHANRHKLVTMDDASDQEGSATDQRVH